MEVTFAVKKAGVLIRSCERWSSISQSDSLCEFSVLVAVVATPLVLPSIRNAMQCNSLSYNSTVTF